MNEPKRLNLSALLQQLDIPKPVDIEAGNSQEAQRLFHGRGHAYKDLHHLTIDWLPPLLWITAFGPVEESCLVQLSEALHSKLPACKSIQIQQRYLPDWPVRCLYGKAITHLTITENSRRYQLTLKSGTNTGLFLDMKKGRDWVQANSQGKRVLNLFAYTCGFSVAAAAGNAKSVYNIDLSSPFLRTGRDNHRLNHHQLESVRFEKLNIMKSFGRIKRHGPYDIIICDPPTYQKGSIDLVKDYPKLIRRLVDCTAKEARLLLCINTPHIAELTGREFLLKCVKENAPQLTLQEEITPPEVFKETQGKGTKVLVFKA